MKYLKFFWNFFIVLKSFILFTFLYMLNIIEVELPKNVLYFLGALWYDVDTTKNILVVKIVIVLENTQLSKFDLIKNPNWAPTQLRQVKT